MIRPRNVLFNIIYLFFAYSLSFASSPGITNYSLTLSFNLSAQQMQAEARVTVFNGTDKPTTTLPFLLYRLLEVSDILDNTGTSLQFSQRVISFSDEKNLQCNSISVNLPQPLQPNDSVRITIKYNGSVFGYPEVMQYVQDKIDENYTLIRSDALAYPMLALPSFESFINAYQQIFTYHCEVSVPKGYTVACGGLLTHTVEKDDVTTFTYESKIATWRIDIAIAKFNTFEDSLRLLFVYALPDDSLGAIRVLKGMKEVISFYSDYFGPVSNYNGYTAIQIPDGWGSQASDYYFLQSSAAFKDSTKLTEVYHEIGHTWNVKATRSVARCRYFDEAFASYFAALAMRAFEGNQSFFTQMEKSRDTFSKWAVKDKKYSVTPIAEYGKEEMGRLSYTKGAWSLYVLHSLIGDNTFRMLIQTLLKEYERKECDFHDLQKIAERISHSNLDKFFNEWIYGNESSTLLLEDKPIQTIVERYK